LDTPLTFEGTRAIGATLTAANTKIENEMKVRFAFMIGFRGLLRT
jgi:hypothetical protein